MKKILLPKWYLLAVLALGFGFCQAQNSEVAMDNEAETETINDASHIFGPVYHVVGPGETVESIMKEFGMNRYQFDRWNSIPNGLKTGMSVIVKYQWSKRDQPNQSALQDKRTVLQSSKTANPVKSSGNFVYHLVEPRETLFRIAEQYHVSVDQLKTWNNLSDNKIKANIQLIVGQ